VRKKDGNCKLLAELELMIGARRILDSVFIIQKQQTCNLHRVCSLSPMLIANDRISKGLGFLTIITMCITITTYYIQASPC
jgi:hypothetical protein